MESWADKQLALLRPQYAGRWDIWFVPLYPRGEAWCAKPAGARVATINVETPEELVAAIAEAEAAAL